MISILEDSIYHRIYQVIIDGQSLYDFQNLRHRTREEYFAEMLQNILHEARENDFILKTITFFEGSYIVILAHK